MAWLRLAPLTPEQRERLKRAQRWNARVNAHPWLHAGAAGAAALLGPLSVNAADGVSLSQNVLPFGPALAGAISAFLFARFYGSRAAHRRVIRLARRYRSAGTAPSA